MVPKPVPTRLAHLLAAVRFVAAPDFAIPFDLSWEGSMQWLGHPHDMLRALRLCTDLRDVICRRSIEAGKRPSKHLDLVALGACITLLSHKHGCIVLLLQLCLHGAVLGPFWTVFLTRSVCRANTGGTRQLVASSRQKLK